MILANTLDIFALLPHALEFVVLMAVLGGLIAVVAEILVKDPKALAEIVTDVRRMAEPERRSSSPVAANTDRKLRKAA